MTPEQISRLPRGARDYIAQLESRVKWLNDKLDGFGKPVEYRQPGISYGVMDDARSIPGEHITLTNKKGDRFQCRLLDDGMLDINVAPLSGMGCVIHPRASNSLYIEAVKR